MSCSSDDNRDLSSSFDKAIEVSKIIYKANTKLEENIKKGDSLFNASNINIDSFSGSNTINFENAVNSMDKKMFDSLMSNDSTFQELYNQSVLKK